MEFLLDLSLEDNLDIPNFVLFQETYTLIPGETYWLTADVAASARADIPEPFTIFGSLVATGAGLLLKHKQKSGGN